MNFATKTGITSSLVRIMGQYVIIQHIFPFLLSHRQVFPFCIQLSFIPYVIQTIGLVKKLKGLETVDSSSVKAKGHGSIAVLKGKIPLTLGSCLYNDKQQQRGHYHPLCQVGKQQWKIRYRRKKKKIANVK